MAAAAEPPRAESMIARHLGAAFDQLHPATQKRFGFGPDSGVYSVGVGHMERVWHGSALFRPFLWLGSTRRIMFSETGSDVPFRMENWAYRDTFGRETLSLNRTFDIPGKRRSGARRFDEYLVIDPNDGALVIYVGSHQHLVADIDVSVSDRGGLVFTTGAQRLFTRLFSVRFPMLLSARARVEEWFDEAAGCFRIDARVRNRLMGDVFACVGSFQSRLEPMPEGGVPAEVRPDREQRRR